MATQTAAMLSFAGYVVVFSGIRFAFSASRAESPSSWLAGSLRTCSFHVTDLAGCARLAFDAPHAASGLLGVVSVTNSSRTGTWRVRRSC